ncbi:MAG: hypothetical protein M3044_07830 [Thermoproteota archaeon]|nr:hypothetical protein [Thermoproteota archaeon]
MSTPAGTQIIGIANIQQWAYLDKILQHGVYTIIAFFMSLKMTLAEIIIAVPTMPTRQCVTNYALSYWLVIVIVLITFVVLLHGANVLS